MKSVITIILAGGVGSRLAPLTDLCTKPAVEAAAKYRIIDFMMCKLPELRAASYPGRDPVPLA